MHYRVSHTTTYTYSEPVTLCHNLAHLMPRNSPRQTCLKSQLIVSPVSEVTLPQQDYFGNKATFFAIQKPHQKLNIQALHETEVLPFAAPDSPTTPIWDETVRRLEITRDSESLDAYQFTFDSPLCQASTALADYARSSFPPRRPLLAAVSDLTSRIHADFQYDPRATTVATPLAEVLAGRRGVCQDFAHLAIGCLRSLGLAARYVSGYLMTTPPADGERLVGGDASHAWLSVYCPGCGWIDVDPTNDQVVSDQHITLAWGRDYGDVTPIKGVILGGRQHTVTVAVDVARTNGAA
jgi:transglutaminase-like putative cysteine protease